MPEKSACRKNPKLWESVKNSVKRGSKGGRPGQWSARKAQLSVKLYKSKGGRYCGPKSKSNSLSKWSAQKWRTYSGKRSLDTGERYLPSKAWVHLTAQERAVLNRTKRSARGQRSKQPRKIQSKIKKQIQK